MQRLVVSDTPVYAGFLGTWILIPQSCEYEQGEPPTEGAYAITEKAGRLLFAISWTDAQGKEQSATFSGKPDGVPEPFCVPGTVDEMSVQAVSPRELRSTAFWRGKPNMIAQRQLDETGRAMRVVQVVMFPDGERLANVATYTRSIPDA